MKLRNLVTLLAGGPGSGCNPDKGHCGRNAKATAKRNPKLGNADYVYHGTSDKFLAQIKKEGLAAKKNYLTPDAYTGHLESQRTVYGDEFRDEVSGKQPKGGNQIVLVIDAKHPSVVQANLSSDPEYDDPDLPSFFTKDKISPKAIVGVIRTTTQRMYKMPKEFVRELKKKGFANKGGDFTLQGAAE